jgi:methyl-accepting chemotaxis protein
MNEMVTGTEQINTAIHHVNDMSNKNRDAITTLMQGVSRFKVE